MTATAQRIPRGAATKLKILAAADELFYSEGIRAVSIEQIIERADTTRMTLYRHFPSKDDLVLAYLQGRAGRERDVVEGLLDRARFGGEPALVLLAGAIGLETSAPSFRGCPFLGAASEFRDPRHPVRHLVRRHRGWYRATVRRMAADARATDPEHTTDQIMFLRDGAMIAAYLGDPAPQMEALESAVRGVLDRG